MVANCDRNCARTRRMLIAASALAIGFSLTAAAQTVSSPEVSADAQSYSSSADYRAYLSSDDLLGGFSSSAVSAASASANPSPSPNPQYGGQRSSQYPSYESRWSHLAFEGGAGFSAPIGNDTHYSTAGLTNGYLSPDVGWGYGVTVGAGWNFTKRVGALLEYQFLRQGMGNDYLNALNAEAGTSGSGTSIGGNINTWSLTIDPIVYLPFGQKNGAYFTGGGGFYRKVTNFTEPVEECSIYYGCYYVSGTVDHFSSNQGGLNIGLGLYRKIFGQDSNAKFYAEVRYVWVDSPVASSSNYYQGSGTEGLIPVTFGIRF